MSVGWSALNATMRVLHFWRVNPNVAGCRAAGQRITDLVMELIKSWMLDL